MSDERGRFRSLGETRNPYRIRLHISAYYPRYGDRDELPLLEQVAKALYNKGVSLLTLGTQVEPGSDEQSEIWARAEEALQLQSQRTGKDLDRLYNYACLLALRGDQEQALDSLEICLEADEITIEHMLGDSDWDPLRSLTKYSTLVERYSGHTRGSE